MRKILFALFAFAGFFPKALLGMDYAFPTSGTIRISPMQEFSGLSREAVLNKRIAAVKSSFLFRNIKEYRPSSAVFQIEDGLPWISAYELTCFGISGSENIGKGESRNSVAILNPDLLFVISMASFAFHSFPNINSCSPIDYLIPYRAYYDRPSNTVSAYIDFSAFYRKNHMLHGIILEDANARDLGYNYVFADKTENIRFSDSTNFSTQITQTSGFFHKGFACKAPTGCNNYSPYQSQYNFYLIDPERSASLHIKLWKNKPADKSDPADIHYELIFR